MTATVVPPTLEPPDSPFDSGVLIDVWANLLPEEIVASRRLAELKRRLMIGLGALVVLLTLAFGYSWWQTENAHNSLASARSRAVGMQNQMRGFAPLVAAQIQSAQIQQTLTGLMADDLQWRDLLTKLRSSAPADVSVENLTANMTGIGGTTAQPSSNGAVAGLPVLNQSGDQTVGSVTVSGSARDKNSIATYVDALSKVGGLAAPFPASVTGAPGKVSFSVDVLITTQALGGRYSTTSTQGGH